MKIVIVTRQFEQWLAARTPVIKADLAVLAVGLLLGRQWSPRIQDFLSIRLTLRHPLSQPVDTSAWALAGPPAVSLLLA